MPLSYDLVAFPKPCKKTSYGASRKAYSKQAEVVTVLLFIAEIESIISQLLREMVSSDYFITLNSPWKTRSAKKIYKG